MTIEEKINIEVEHQIYLGRPTEPSCFENDQEETWWKVGACDGVDYMRNKLSEILENHQDPDHYGLRKALGELLDNSVVDK